MRAKKFCKISRSEQLSVYMDGMLDGQSTREVSYHVDHCEDCSKMLQHMLQIRSMMQAKKQSTEVVDSTFWADAYRSARVAASKDTVRRSLPAVGGWRLLTLVGAACAMFGLFAIPSTSIHDVHPVSVDMSQTIDVNALVASHADLTAFQPLADHSRLTMVESDTSTQLAGDSSNDSATAPEGAPDAGVETD